MKKLILLLGLLCFSVSHAGYDKQPFALSKGGTASVTAQSALDTLFGATTTNQACIGNGTHIVLGALTSSYIPSLDFSKITTGTVPITQGGTGLTTLTAHAIYAGNATSAPTPIAPGTSGNILTSNGTDWVSTTPSGGGTVTSVGLTDASTAPLFTITNTPVSTTGTLTMTATSQTDGTYYGGPNRGQASGQSTFKSFLKPTYQNFTTTGTATGKLFALTTSPTVSAGATYTNNSVTYTVTYALAANTPLMYASGTGTTSGTTLTKTAGTGPSTLTFSGTPRDTATYTAPTNPAPLYIVVEAVGGGGGGGPGGGITAGSGGSSGTSTVFGGIICGAGGGGSPGTTTAVGSYGNGSLNFLLTNFTSIKFLNGFPGNAGSTTLSSAYSVPGGHGGRSEFNDSPSGTSNSYGDGGDGNDGGSAVYPGGGGSAGGYFQGMSTTLLATYPYIVGTGGAGGTPGSSGNAGLAGQPGKITVKEVYQ